MEVHHKHHVPKKIKEYITEFLMLFTAVTLGFFAENYREHSLVEKKMHQNYESLVEDLKIDSGKIVTLIERSKVSSKNLMQLQYNLYRYHSGKIGYNELLAEVKKLKTLPVYSTLFINNTTFKNIQSSGMLSYINSRETRFQISYYYEVMFKQLQDNNAIFDQNGMDFFDRNFPFAQAILSKTIPARENPRAGYEKGFSDPEKYLDFMLSLPESRRILQSDQLVYQCEVYYQRNDNYTGILRHVLNKNQSLLKQIRTLIAEG